MRKKWSFAIDRGGTFTDVIGRDPNGVYHTKKLLSVSRDYNDPSIEGIRRVLGIKGGPLPEDLIECIRLGTTVATNALLTRGGGRVALFITKGFGDLLKVGYQARPDIFALSIEETPELYSKVVEVDERFDSYGRIVRSPDFSELTEEIRVVKDGGFDAVAVVFMHSWKDPRHELLLEEELKKHGITDIILSHRSINLINIVTRGHSAVVDAYLSPVLSEYLRGIKAYTGKIPVEFIQSSGHLCAGGDFAGKSAIYSGPAGGVIAVGSIATERDAGGLVGFDMGGTSTDVSRFDAIFEHINEERVGGIELSGDSLAIKTVASGGGSILWFDGAKMRVGPESAGAMPGPASYGFAGPLTVTDANLLTGRIDPARFPQIFGPDGCSPLDKEAASGKLSEITEEINSATGAELTPAEAALGFLEIANEKMALAIREISVAKGFDIRDYGLLSFGGAGGQHACSVATLLGIKKVLYHPLSSLMSAYGIGLATKAARRVKSLLTEFTRASYETLEAKFLEMEAGLEGDISREVDIRTQGTRASIPIFLAGFDEMKVGFKERYTRLFGFYPEEAALEAVNLRVESLVGGPIFGEYHLPHEGGSSNGGGHTASQAVLFKSGELEVELYELATLGAGTVINGPAILTDRDSSLVVDPGFTARVEISGMVVVQYSGREDKERSFKGNAPDPVLLEVFSNIFSSIGMEMGHTLRSTSSSVNIKERLDFSCAVFDANGALVANAPHIPVHLGSMADTVRSIIEERGAQMRAGDIYLSNNPYKGGSHLPDVTVVSPIFNDFEEIIFFTAARGHHADIGGVSAGSMPALASHIDEEGVLIDNLLIVRDGKFFDDILTKLFKESNYPVRNADERMLDIKAQIAACKKGEEGLLSLVARYGLETVKSYMGFIQDNGEQEIKRALLGMLGEKDRFESSFSDSLDDGTPIEVRVEIVRGDNAPETVAAVIDFAGTGPAHTTDNLNAPVSVIRSAVLYVLRLLSKSDIPLNSGCLRPVNIIVPEGSILNPACPLPVASGNVETSQRIVDVLLGAFNAAAASQGTMNNLLFRVAGEAPYYETIGGGSGATATAPGASGVQVHMTNTRMTDPEVLEINHPGIRLVRFSLREGSGGAGAFKGGDGLVREIEFLKPAEVTIISERRKTVPYGVEGGAPGKAGRNAIRRTDGRIEELGYRESLEVSSGEMIIIETPGGGGWGSVKD